MLVSFSIFGKFGDYTFFFLSLSFCYFVILAILTIVFFSVFFFVAMKFLVTFAIFADFLRFLQAISIKHIFAKLRQIAIVVFRHFAILLEFFYFCFICYFFYTFLTVSLIFFYQNCEKSLLPNFCESVQSWTQEESHKVALRNSFNHFNEKKINTIVREMWSQ